MRAATLIVAVAAALILSGVGAAPCHAYQLRDDGGLYTVVREAGDASIQSVTLHWDYKAGDEQSRTVDPTLGGNYRQSLALSYSSSATYFPVIPREDYRIQLVSVVASSVAYPFVVAWRPAVALPGAEALPVTIENTLPVRVSVDNTVAVSQTASMSVEGTLPVIMTDAFGFGEDAWRWMLLLALVLGGMVIADASFRHHR